MGPGRRARALPALTQTLDWTYATDSSLGLFRPASCGATPAAVRLVKYPAGGRPRAVQAERLLDLAAVGQAGTWLARPADVCPRTARRGPRLPSPASRREPADSAPREPCVRDLLVLLRLSNDRSTPKPGKCRQKRVPPVGFEPTTCGLEVRCSIQLSYRGSARELNPGRAGRRRSGAPVEASRAPRTFRALLARVREQTRREDVAAEVRRVDPLAAQRLVQALRLPQRERLGE
jgi:hypothetical protein